jgi:hypothetical protein
VAAIIALPWIVILEQPEVRMTTSGMELYYFNPTNRKMFIGRQRVAADSCLKLRQLPVLQHWRPEFPAKSFLNSMAYWSILYDYW